MTAGYGDVFEQWRDGCQGIWSAYTRHAFVAGLGDGTLPREAFLRYLRQDYVFLIHFSRAWALAVVKAGSLAEMTMASSLVNALINEEMKLHVGVCAAAGIAFTVSVDNLSLKIPQSMLEQFENKLRWERNQFQKNGLPKRAELFSHALRQGLPKKAFWVSTVD